MPEEIDLSTTEKRVAYILEHVPATRSNYLLLILTYWQVFDGINIPPELAQQIAGVATQPETVNRSRRKVIEKLKILEELELLKRLKGDYNGKRGN